MLLNNHCVRGIVWGTGVWYGSSVLRTLSLVKDAEGNKDSNTDPEAQECG